MPVPKKRRSRSRRRTYHAYFKSAARTTNKCSNCGEITLPHMVCSNCGYYKGKKVMVTKSEKSADRKARKKAEADKNKNKK